MFSAGCSFQNRYEMVTAVYCFFVFIHPSFDFTSHEYYIWSSNISVVLRQKWHCSGACKSYETGRKSFLVG